ncbi:hypothetical protein MNBD_ALPHA12-2196 [hydrothermal vent metagenome]|uniref:Uncharacterized protein n=1 Tax=hydrothermal vent metagenome TaxID=652676 RepID=A0A3B0TRB5_9ZZZZ
MEASYGHHEFKSLHENSFIKRLGALFQSMTILSMLFVEYCLTL